MTIIGVCGNISAGKTTVADWLVAKHGFREINFAGYLKEIAEHCFGTVNKDENGRHILQQVGGKMREIDSNAWINALESKINESPHAKWVIGDLRHVNEYEWLMSRGGTLIFLDAMYHLRKDRTIKRDKIKITDRKWAEMHSHPSEVEVYFIRDRLSGITKGDSIRVAMLNEEYGIKYLLRDVEEELRRRGIIDVKSSTKEGTT